MKRMLIIGNVDSIAMIVGLSMLPLAQNVFAQSAEDLAKQLANPVASLISVPFQLNYDTNIGQDDGKRYLLNIQPVIPFSMNDD